jgi:hypothetical protein
LQKNWAEAAYKDYSFARLSMDDIVIEYKRKRSTTQRSFAKLKIKQSLSVNTDKHVSLIPDAVYFGRSLCCLVFNTKLYEA